MIQVNTIKKRSDEIYANRPKNQGGIVGGLKYVGASLAAGVGGIAEGVFDVLGARNSLITGDSGDATSWIRNIAGVTGIGGVSLSLYEGARASKNLINGNTDSAKKWFLNNEVGDWYEEKREEYNPNGVMGFVGDVSRGLGQSAYLFIPYAGAPLFYTGVVANSISDAAAKTGDVGVKEVAYGATMGAVEGAVDALLGGTATTISSAVKGIGKTAGKATGKSILKATSDATRKGLTKKILSSAASEFAEEAVSEYADTIFQRAYQIDPNASTSLKDMIYAGAVGAVSGAVSTSAVQVPKSINYQKKGESIIKRGNSQTLVNTATKVADRLAAKGTSFKDAAEWVTALRGQVDAYNDLVKKGKGESASAKTILGEMQAYLYFAETKAAHAGITGRIMNASEEDRAALAEYINMTVKEADRPRTYTAEDVKNNTDEIASQLAIMEYAGIALNYDAIKTDEEYEREIEAAIAAERGAKDGQSGTPVPTEGEAEFSPAFAAAVERSATEPVRAQTVAKSQVQTAQPRAQAAQPQAQGGTEVVAPTVDKAVAKTVAPTGAPQAQATVKAKAQVTANDIKTRLTRATNKVEVDGKLYEISKNDVETISKKAEALIREGKSETEAVAQAVNENLGEIKSLSSGGSLTTTFAKGRISKIKGAIINAYRQQAQSGAAQTLSKTTTPSVQKSDASAAARSRTEAAARFEADGETAGASPRPTSETKNEAEKKSSERNEKSSESANDMPKVSKPKEILNEAQRAERARKRAERIIEWEKENPPSVKELNRARSLVKGFDNLSPEKRQSIIRMIRSAQGVDEKIVKGVANLMAIKAGADLEVRFDDQVGEYGMSATIGDKTLILVSSMADYKDTVKGTVAHELVHYLEKKPGYKTFADYVLKTVKPEAKAKVEKDITERYNEHYRAEYEAEYAKRGLKGAELESAVNAALESEEHKALIKSEVVAELVGKALNNEKFLARYARRGNTDGFIKKAWSFLKGVVQELKSKEENELAEILMPTIKSMDRLLQMESTGEGKSGKKYSFSSIAYTFFGEEDMTVGEFTERNYKETEGYKAYVEECLSNFRQSRGDSFNEAAARKEIEDGIAGIVRVAVAAKKAGYDIYDSAGQRNARDSKQRLLFSSLEPNSDYFTSSDISTICDKRKNFTEIEDEINRIEAEKGVPREKRFFADINNFFTLHDILARHGLTTACRQCYVESMRKNLGRMANAFIDLVTETDENNKSNKQLYNKGELKSGNAELRRKVRELIEQENIPSEYLKFETLTNGEKLADMRLQHPLLFEAYNSFYGQSKPKTPKSATPFRFGELTALLTDHNGKINQGLLKRINSTGGFRLQSYSDFQIKNYVDVLQVIFEAGTLGLNGHAYTKVPAFLDATEGTNLKRNISIFMYRDGNEWKIDRNDSFPWRLEKIYEVVNADKSGDTGIIAVSQNDDMSAWIMANDNVGYGIPFHKSGTKMGVVRETVVKTPEGDVKGYLGIKDHTKYQSEVYAKGENKGKKVKAPINIYEFWDFNNTRMSREGLIEKNVKKYIDECERLGYLPKFRDYVMNNEKVLQATLEYAKKLGYADANATVDDISFKYKGYTIPYGYYKFLVDFGVFTPDGKASPVKALSLKNYDFDKAVRFFSDSKKLRINELLQQIANGEERDKYRKLMDEGKMTIAELGKVIKDKRDAVVAEVVGERKYSLAVKGESETKTEITGKYSYDSLIRKNPLVFAEFEEDFPKLSDQKTMDRNKIVEAARENARLQNNPNNTSYATYVYVSSIDKDVLIGKQGLTHGLSHGATETALATMKIGELLKNSIAVNELNARTTNKSSTDMSYVLIAVGKNKTDSFIVRMVVDKTTSEVTQISTFGLYSIRAKKEGELFSPNGDEADAYKSSSPYLLSTISISDLLEKVKDISIINEIFSKDVADKLNVTRSNGDLTNSRRYSLAPKKSQTNAKEAGKKVDAAKAEDDKVTELENKMRKMRERMARERAEYAKVEGAQVFSKSDVKLAVDSIEGWTQEEVLSLAKGQELQGMSRAKREEMISQIYVALHEEGAKGRVSTGHIAVKGLALKIADEYLDSARVKGEDGKSIHLRDIYDEKTIEDFKRSLADLLFGEFAHMGQTTQNAEFQAIIRAQKESFLMDQFNNKLEAKEARNLAYQGQKLRELVEVQKRDGAAEDIALVTKTLAAAVDSKGNIRVNALDKAIGEASRFFEGEKAKIESEKNALKTEDGKDTRALSDFAWTVNDELKYMIDEYLRLRKGREGKGFTAEELKLAADVLRAMKVTIERYNKEYIDGHWVDVEAAAKECVADLTADWRKVEYKNKVTAALGKAVGGVKENYFYKILTPETVVETIEGFAKNGVLKRLYHSIRVHKQKAEHLAVQMKKPLAEFIDSKEHRYTDDKGIPHSFRTKLNKKMISIDGTDITLGEAIYLYMLTKREPAHAGLLEEGYIVFNDKNQSRARIKIADIERTRSNIYNQLDATDIEFLKMSEDFFNKTASKIKYDADMHIFGYTNVQDGYYVPMIRDRYGRMNGVTDARQSIGSIVTVYNKSFNQNLVENAKALEGKNIMSIINDHADGLADYAELYLPLKAFDRTYNRAVMTKDGVSSIRKVLNDDVWNGTERYFKDLFKDIQGQREREENPLNNVVGKIRSGWVNSVLGANVKVIATQTTSLVAATQVIGAKYITKCSYLASPGKLPGLDEIRERAYKYSDIIEARNFDMGALKAQGNIDKVNKIGELSGWGIGWMDERICLAIFHAAELQVQDQKGFAVGTEENAKLAAKLADEAIYTTQSMSSASERSAWQRSDSEIMKMLTMFTSDTVKNLSHFFGNINKWNAYRMRNNASDGAYEAELKQAGKDVRRSIRTLAATGIMLGLIAQAFKYLFGKEEEEPEDKQKDFYKDIAGSTLNILPGVSDVFDKLVFNYDMSINVIDVANDTIESVGAAFKTAGKSMSGEYVSRNEAIENSVGVVRSGLTLFGIPLSPVEKLVTGLLRFVSPEAAYGYNNIFGNPSYTADLKKAVESGDGELAEYVLEKLYESEMSGVYTSAELEEIVRLYSLTDEKGKHYNVLPQRVPEKLDDDTKMSAAQRKQFNKIYSQSSAKVNELIRSDYYAALDDKAKAKAISNIYGLYFDTAKAQVMGKDWSANVAYSYLTGNVTALMASKAYKSGIEEYKDERGKTVTVKEQFAEYLKGLELSKEDQLIIAYANGYKGKATTKSILKYINSLGLPAETLEQIAKALNLEVKDGTVVEKTE